MLWAFVGLAVALLVLGALMAAVDAALTSLSHNDLEAIAQSSRSARSIRAIAEDTHIHLNAVNFVRILTETSAAAVVTLIGIELTNNVWWALLIAVVVMTVMSFLLVGVSPRSVGRAQSTQIIRLTSPLVHGIRVVLGPVATLLVSLGNRVTPNRSRGAGVSTERELLSVVDQATASDVLEEDDRQLIRSVLEFDDTVVRSVMVPRTDMVTIPADADLDEALASFLRSGVSRMPVVGDDIDDIDRVLYLRDLVKRHHAGAVDATANQVARQAVLVPESMKLDALLRQMQREHTHLALVVDEYGGIAGLVTLEDLIEELVGDIADEYDRQAAEINDLGGGVYRVSARLSVTELGELFGLELDDEDVDTVGGLLTKQLGRLPLVNDEVEVSGLRLQAVEVIGRRRLVSVRVEADAALTDAMKAFGVEEGQ